MKVYRDLTNLCVWVFLLVTACMPANSETIVGRDKLAPANIRQQVHKHGAKQTVAALYSNNATWEELLRNISSGEREWLQIAVELKDGADAGSSEMIKFAVGEALANKPENVIGIAIKKFSLQAICSEPDIDDARYSSYEKAVLEINRRIAVLKKYHTRQYQQVRNECIVELNKSKSRLKTFYEIR
jgi:hypothetical protein